MTAEEALALVRQLAQMEPWDTDSRLDTVCFFCDAEGGDWGRPAQPHTETCIWQRAQEEHEPGCPAIADDESDYEHLSDAGMCVCRKASDGSPR